MFSLLMIVMAGAFTGVVGSGSAERGDEGIVNVGR